MPLDGTVTHCIDYYDCSYLFILLLYFVVLLHCCSYIYYFCFVVVVYICMCIILYVCVLQ